MDTGTIKNEEKKIKVMILITDTKIITAGNLIKHDYNRRTDGDDTTS